MKTPARPSSNDVARSEINVTPLVDVCLVLLIIFMVVGPMLTRHPAGVRLPETRRPDPLAKQRADFALTVKADRTTWWRGRRLPPVELLGTLRETRDRSGGVEINLVADRSLAMGDVKEVMRIVHEAGYPGFALVATRETR